MPLVWNLTNIQGFLPKDFSSFSFQEEAFSYLSFQEQIL